MTQEATNDIHSALGDYVHLTQALILVAALRFDTHKHRDREQIHTRSLGW